MVNENKLKIIIGIIYLFIVMGFLFLFFSYFSFDDFSSFELIKNNRNKLNEIKNSNLFIASILFLIGVIIWVMLLGFGSPVTLVGGFIFGKWIGTILIVFGLSIGATILYVSANYLFKDLIEKKFSSKFSNLTEKFKKNEFIFFLIYRFVGGIPFFISNILPTLFNVKIINFFLGSVIGMTPQLFIGASLGAGLNKIIENNQELPSIFDIILTPDIYLPVIGLIILVLIGIIIRKKFYK
ncbi:VTT domain-containing protein [Candidatus Pelagibacter sp.]|nr:VTT domain-containing protein [Candidatus Pelagibacter sp.]